MADSAHEDIPIVFEEGEGGQCWIHIPLQGSTRVKKVGPYPSIGAAEEALKRAADRLCGGAQVLYPNRN